jgi:hypothetical protein
VNPTDLRRHAFNTCCRLGLALELIEACVAAAKAGMTRQDILDNVREECGRDSLLYLATEALVCEDEPPPA